MSVSAATHSQALNSAPVPRRLGLNDLTPEQQRYKAMGASAVDLVERAGGNYATQEKLATVKATLMANFGIDEHSARTLVAVAGSTLHKRQSGSSGSRFAPYQFGSPEAAKGFAQAKMGDLDYAVQNYNLSVKDWSVVKVRSMWEEGWNTVFTGRLRNNGGDEAEAIRFAEESLKSDIQRTRAVSGDRYQLNLARGGLISGFGPLPENFLTENADGTLTINRKALAGTVLGNLLNVGSTIGQQVDRAA